MLVSSIQRETSDCRRGTFYFDINLKFCWLRFQSNHGGIKIQGPQVDVRAPFRSPRSVRHNNLNWRPKLVRTTQSCYWTSNTRYTRLRRQQKQLNESNNCSTRYSSIQILPKRVDRLTLTLPWLLHHPKLLENNCKRRLGLPGHLGNVNFHHLTAYKALNPQPSRLIRSNRNSSKSSKSRSLQTNGKRI